MSVSVRSVDRSADVSGGEQMETTGAEAAGVVGGGALSRDAVAVP